MKKLLLTLLVLSGIGSFAFAAEAPPRKDRECVEKCRDDYGGDSAEYEKCLDRCQLEE